VSSSNAAFLGPPFVFLRERKSFANRTQPGRGCSNRVNPRTTALAGDPQGGGSPSCGGSRQQRRLPAFFAGGWRASGVGGTRPPRLSPEGKRERGDQIPCAAGYFFTAAVHPHMSTLHLSLFVSRFALLSAVLSPCFHPHSSREPSGLRCTLAFVISAGAAI
jgi:hypothetical protein